MNRSSVLALGLVIAMGVIFYKMDNKPLSNWTLATACAMALLYSVSAFFAQPKWLYFKNALRKLSHLEVFREASHGVWGCLVLLTTIRWNLATVGALIKIFRLGLGPLAQQVIDYEQRNVHSSSNKAAFGYAYNYTRGVDSQVGNSDTSICPQDPGMQSAVYQGLFGIKTPEPFTCPGACCWTKSYISLGFRTECRNVTEATLQTKTCGRRISCNNECNMTTPAGLGLTSHHSKTDSATLYAMNANLPNIERRTVWEGDLPEVMRFAMFRSTCDFYFNMSHPNITICSLYSTAYEYTGVRANGSTLSIARRRELTFGTANPWQSDRIINSINHAPLYTNETRHDGVQIPRLEVEFASLQALVNFFSSDIFVTEWVNGNMQTKSNAGAVTPSSGDADIPARFNAMATAITGYLLYGPNTQTAKGEIVESVMFVALALIFALLNIVMNRKSRRVPLWKSSTLALLDCQVDGRLGLI
ncbi:hypothetical protein BDW74DRAFT_171654 [Aspergillus multicolor]|uniref:DUF3176 domain-containing protein n=1 Tax=Aspergillus multicolor TaxID=41759 RepID=UPI003CCCDFCB